MLFASRSLLRGRSPMFVFRYLSSIQTSSDLPQGLAGHSAAFDPGVDRKRKFRHETARLHHVAGGAATVWPFAARAQQPEQVRRIGVLMNVAADDPEASARESGHATGLAVIQAHTFCNTWQKSAFL